MPALNIEFSDEELAALREAAEARHVSLKALVREAVATDLAHRRALEEGAGEFRRFAERNTAAFDDAFPGSAPGRSAGAA
jgi:predicted transcriptional regulator